MKCKKLNGPVRIDTRRLLLKTPSLSDLQSVQECWNLDGKRISLPEATAQVERILLNLERIRQGALVHLCLAVVEKESGRFIGWCGIAHDDDALPFPVIFFLLKKAYWGKGYGTEAAAAALDFGFRQLGLEQIDGACAAGNAASKRIMEGMGMRYRGLDASGGHSFSLRLDEYLKGAGGA